MDEIRQQLFDCLLEHVEARLRALPPKWRVAVKIDCTDRTVSHMNASWTLRPVGPGEPAPTGWALFGPLPCDTESRHGAA